MTETTGAIEAMWRESERKDRERRRRRHSAAWYEFYSRLADSHARMSEDFERRAVSLLEEPWEGRRMSRLGERIWGIEREAPAQDETLAAAKKAALARLGDEEREVVEQVLDSVKDAQTRGELESVLEVLDASFGDAPRLMLAEYAALVEEERRSLRREGEGDR